MTKHAKLTAIFFSLMMSSTLIAQDSVSGYDESLHNTPILDKSSPYQHRATVGIAIGM